MDATQTIGIIYCVVSALSAFILITNAITIAQTTARYTIARYVFYSYLLAGLAAIFDCAYALREINEIAFPVAFSYIFTLAYAVCFELTGMYWIIYSEKKQNSWFSRSKKRMAIFMAPFFVIIALTATTPFTHLYFYFEGTDYQRGLLFTIISSLLFVYIVQNGVKALVYSLKKENYVERHEFRRLFIYAFFYLLIQIIQIVLPSVFPYRSVGTMLIFLIFLIQNMKEMIGLDSLTRINNRYALDRYLGTLMAQNHNFEIVLIDVDKFKGINDKYGHVEGDKALRMVAETMKEVSPKNCYFARWGGDEFVVVNNDINHSVLDIEIKINEKLSYFKDNRICDYRISVSAGCIKKDSSIGSIPDLLKIVDEKLYERKTSK